MSYSADRTRQQRLFDTMSTMSTQDMLSNLEVVQADMSPEQLLEFQVLQNEWNEIAFMDCVEGLYLRKKVAWFWERVIYI